MSALAISGDKCSEAAKGIGDLLVVEFVHGVLADQQLLREQASHHLHVLGRLLGAAGHDRRRPVLGEVLRQRL